MRQDATTTEIYTNHNTLSPTRRSSDLEEIQSRQIPIDRLVDIPRITRSFVANVVKRTRTTEKLVVDREEVAEIMTCSSERAKKVKVRTEESPQLNRARGTRHCGFTHQPSFSVPLWNSPLEQVCLQPREYS